MNKTSRDVQSYMCVQVVTDFMKDVGMYTCKLSSLLVYFALPSLLHSTVYLTCLCPFLHDYELLMFVFPFAYTALSLETASKPVSIL